MKRNAFDILIEETAIEESYGVDFTKKTWVKIYKLFSSLLKEYNLKIT